MDTAEGLKTEGLKKGKQLTIFFLPKMLENLIKLNSANLEFLGNTQKRSTLTVHCATSLDWAEGKLGL